MIAARTAQGYEEFKASTPQERLAIIRRWNELEAENLQFSQNKGRTQSDSHEARNSSPKGFFNTRHLSFDERKRLYEERKANREAERNKIQCQDGKTSCPFCRRINPHAHTPFIVDPTPVITEPQPHDTNPDFERAIQASVAATSRGDPDEDAMIERAIRASVRELQNDTGTATSNKEALNRAIQASVSAAGPNTSRASSSVDDNAEYQTVLEKSIRDSLASYKLQSRAKATRKCNNTEDEESQRSALAPIETETDGIDSDEDEDIKLAIQKIQGGTREVEYRSASQITLH
jgi:hypothetical protein